MQKHRIPLPPAPPSTDIPRESASGRAPAPASLLAVQYPESGMTFQIDPVLKRQFQQVHLRAAAARELRDITWWIDGAPLDAAFDDATWPLIPGTHTIALQAETKDRRTIHSPSVSITVLAPERPAAPVDR
jgi:hypothetical protein